MYITHIGSEITNIIIYVFEKMAGSRQHSTARLERVRRKNVCVLTDRDGNTDSRYPTKLMVSRCWRYSILDNFVSDTENQLANSFGINQRSLWLITVIISYKTINYQGGSNIENLMQIPSKSIMICGKL